MPFSTSHRLNNSPNEDADNRLLLQKVSKGERKAYTELYQQYLPGLYQYIFRFTKQSKQQTEEIVQEVFLSIWEKKETLVAIKFFESYLYRTAKNKLLNLLKHEEHTTKLHNDFGLIQDTFNVATETDLQYSEYLKTAKIAIEKLPEKRKLVFILSTQQGLSLDEIAEQMGISRSMVKKQLYSARHYIKKYLQDNAEWLFILALFIKDQ